ncbi:hypothetical protein [Pandoraea terrigena]|uniref:Uncharacterized protein n=1 Tax=Pandoraea terrigena TaxID=2508292 RepID=A0A5E4YVR4_9BURK|nr:hypothetical protein [Pandoraea terrigena]VVE52582.1 hypothetical protein PTE31013_04825 [Pandoraea terrigena]
MELLLNVVAFALVLVLVSLVWDFFNSEANPRVARQADEFIRQAKSKPLKSGQTEQQLAVQLALAAGKDCAASIVYARLYGVTIFEARKAVHRLVTIRILTS